MVLPITGPLSVMAIEEPRAAGVCALCPNTTLGVANGKTTSSATKVSLALVRFDILVLIAIPFLSTA
jgi:hypothetical protein